MKEINKKLITDLIQITSTIEKVYSDLAKYEYQENNEKYQESLENLKVCLELEENIYQKIKPSSKNFDKDLQQLKRLFYLQSLEVNSRSEERIFRYLTILPYLNPFLSMKETLAREYQENTNIITSQYSIDFCYQLIHLLEEQIQNTQNKILKRRLLQTKYDNIFVNKIIEPNLFQPKDLSSRRKTCILFSQDQDLVNGIYESECREVFELSLNTILNIDTMKFTSIIDKVEEELLNYIDIEVALSIISEESFNNFYEDYDFLYLMEPTLKNKKEIKNIDNIFKKIKSIHKNQKKSKIKSISLTK